MGIFDWFKKEKPKKKHPLHGRSQKSTAPNDVDTFTLVRIDVNSKGYAVESGWYYGPGDDVWFYTNGPGTLTGEIRARTSTEAKKKIRQKTGKPMAKFHRG